MENRNGLRLRVHPMAVNKRRMDQLVLPEPLIRSPVRDGAET